MLVQGHDRAAGHILTLTVSNSSPFVEEICLMEGDVLVPSDPAYQRMMVGSEVQLEIAPGSQEDLPIDGFCLDPHKLPPPSDPAKCTYTPAPTESDELRSVQEILKVADQLIEDGALAEDIQSPEKYRNTIIERAIWCVQTRESDKPFDEAKLTQDLISQVEKLPEDKRPSKEETEKTAARIWDDVDLTIKTAESAPHHPAR